MQRQLTNGQPVPEDGSHKEIDPDTGMQKGYIVLSPEERAKGFRKPVRYTYVHTVCGVVTTVNQSLAETCARDPYFYSGTFCVGCRAHYPLSEFNWDEDGEPMDPYLQEEWASKQGERDTAARARCKHFAILRKEELLKQLVELDKEIESLL